jgi:ABC-2 type transport system ATP-binding protein
MISCRDLTCRYGDFIAVDRLTLDISTGSICAFLGPNGAGKSTTLKMLTGLIPPTSGSATVAGLDVVRDALELKRRIGVLPENLGLFDDLTVDEHLDLTGAVYKLSRAETKDRSNQLLRALHLEHGRHTFASRCSHGMRKKTSLAMALLANPKVLFLDEPLEAIDPVTAKTITDLLVTIAQRGITVFLTSHILAAVEQFATRVVLIRKGVVAWNSTIEEVPGSLEKLYFDLVEGPPAEDLKWLGSSQS